MSNLWFLLLLILLPVQLGRHFWPDFAILSGLRVDYFSPTIYLTDIIVFFLLFSRKTKIKISKILVAFLAVVIIGIYFSKNPYVALYGLLKLIEFILLGLFIAREINLGKMWDKISLALSFGILLESVLAIGQFYNQSSIGGLFWFLGERTFNGSVPGIANAVINGELWLRPYGTFSHPNVLAGYLVITMTMISSRFGIQGLGFKKIIFAIALTLGSISLFLTMSRVAILIWLVVGCWSLISVLKLFKKRKIFSIFSVLLAVLVISIVFINTPIWSRFSSLNFLDESVVRREELIISSLLMLKDHPLFGVGLNNFLVNLAFYQKTQDIIFYLQPVHNIYLLTVSEIGIIGLGMVLWFIKKTYQNIKHQPLSIILSIILILGFFDHYFLTIQQGQLLLTFIISLCWSQARIKS